MLLLSGQKGSGKTTIVYGVRSPNLVLRLTERRSQIIGDLQWGAKCESIDSSRQPKKFDGFILLL
jgi:hypothetical protein